jgi:hypothetical protein
VELLRVTPHTLNTEEISKLWTATQSSYRPTAAYHVSVVLIEATRPARAALPVLSRGEFDPVSGRERGVVVTPDLVPPQPTIQAVLPANDQPAMRLVETIVLQGHHLDGSGREVMLNNDRFRIEETLAASGPNLADRMEFSVPSARAADFPVGVYAIRARVTRPGESLPRETNRLAAVLAPEITNLPQTVARDGGGTVQISIDFTPELRPGQRVSLLLGQREIPPQGFTAPIASLDFVVEDAALGDHLARLRIDGVESPIVDRSTAPPTFFDLRVTIT